jgi:hypothetical protein
VLGDFHIQGQISKKKNIKREGRKITPMNVYFRKQEQTIIMDPKVRNILSALAGIIVGGSVNMFIVLISSKIIPPPPGADVTTVEGLKASLHLFQPQHFIMPFLAHALGTFTGALIAVRLTAGSVKRVAMIVAVFNLIGGLTNAYMLPAPAWFIALDLGVAYLPMAFLAIRLSGKKASDLIS